MRSGEYFHEASVQLVLLIVRRLHVILLLLAAVAGIAVYFYFDPEDSMLFPRCPFLALTGLECPGCGSQRAVHALLHGDFPGAWRYNALLVASLPFLAVLIGAEMTRTRYPGFYRAVNSGRVIMACAVVVVGWWILRNLVSIH